MEQFDDHCLFFMLAFCNGLEYSSVEQCEPAITFMDEVDAECGTAVAERCCVVAGDSLTGDQADTPLPWDGIVDQLSVAVVGASHTALRVSVGTSYHTPSTLTWPLITTAKA